MLHFVAKIENHQIALRHFRFQDFFKKNLGREKQGPPVLTTGSQKMGRNTKEGNSDRLSPRCWGYSTPINFFGRPSAHTSQKSPKVCSLVQSAILSFNNFHPMDLSLHPSALNCWSAFPARDLWLKNWTLEFLFPGRQSIIVCGSPANWMMNTVIFH